ncbi:MAG: TonB-dependent receptor plug domain-containing protein [Calditrichaeota bacterium]|nr:TonB-dependent receptor plug domain-containing protein [Calditrichota bacterium]MCB9366402.1 TonB-dependent receptor plug domain-containing protein [Calditrichota bacterium]
MDAKTLIRVALVACFFSTVVWADDLPDPYVTLPEVLISSVGNGVVRTFSREEIEKSGARNVTDFLRQVPGIAIRNDAVSGGKQFVRLGGSNVNQVLVLVDGVRIDDIGSGEADLSRLPVEWIESLEIVQGGSAMGGEAIGGVVSIRTLSHANRCSELSADGTTTMGAVSAKQSWKQNELQIHAGMSRAQGNGRYRYRITEYDGNGSFTRDLGETFHRENNALTKDRFVGKIERPIGSFQIQGTALIERAEFGLPGYLAPRPTPLASQEESFTLLQFSGSSDTPIGAVEVTFASQEQAKDFTDPDPYSFLHESHERSSRGTALAKWSKSFESWTVASSIQGERERLSSGILQNDDAVRNRWRCSNSVGYEHKVGSLHRLNSSAGIGIEKFGDSDVQVLPFGDIAYHHLGLLQEWIGLHVAKSYLAPSFYSLFWNDELLAQGNPDLRPESGFLVQVSGGVSTGYRFATAVDFTLSRNRVHDLIYWRQAFDGRWTPQNLRKASLDAASVTLTQQLIPEIANASFSMEWLEARDRSGERTTDGKYLIYRPARTFRADANVTKGDFHGAVSLLWSDKQAVLETNSKWLPEYTLVNASVSKSFTIGETTLECGVSCENVIDVDYRLVRHAPMPLREMGVFVNLVKGS